MADVTTLTGFVATQLKHFTTGEGLPITSFRLASNQRRFDRAKDAWVDMETNWYTITAFRQIALNTNSSIRKGDRIIVTGRLRIREWENGTRKGTSIELDVDAIGHDLAWGTTSFTRNAIAGERAPGTDRGEAEAFPSEDNLDLDARLHSQGSFGSGSPLEPAFETVVKPGGRSFDPDDSNAESAADAMAETV